MFAPASSQNDYTLVSALDPSLELPEIPTIADDASADDVTARDKIKTQRDHLLKVARDHGNWPAIVKPGQRPTMFTFRQIFGADLSWLQGEIDRRQLSPGESFELAFRLAFKSVDNFGAYRPQWDVGDPSLLSKSSLEPFYSIGRDIKEPQLGRVIIAELGMLVFNRAIRGVDPL
jgi:hypothetical protein